MFKAIMKVQWKWTRAAVLVGTIIGFAIPLVSVRYLMGNLFYGQPSPGQVIRTMQDTGALYAFLAGFMGLCAAFLAWNPDQKGRHIYALSLPISRAKYALMRFGAGSIFLLLPTLGVLIGCLVAVALAEIPIGMHAYPVALAFRFLLASFVGFAVFFAVAASSQRAAAYLLGSFAAYIFLSVIISAIGLKFDLLGKTMDFLFTQPGLLSIFTGRWMLIDV